MLPIVAVLIVIALTVYRLYNIERGKIPFGLFFIPNGANLTVVIKMD
jgi:hypothetical protein